MAPSLDQQRAVNDVIDNKNIAVYGPAGYGKSFVRDCITTQRESCVLGPTGMSIAKCKGTTIDRFIGTIHTFKISSRCVLIIEEISLVPASLFIALSKTLQSKLNSNKAFGGLQTVLIGDVYQLIPPGETSFFFETDEYTRLNITIHQLTTPHRTKDVDLERENIFNTFLRCCRHGKFTNGNEGYLTFFNSRTHPPNIVKICPTRTKAYQYNMAILKQHSGHIINLRGFEFFIGARVIITKNIYNGHTFIYANGWTGIVESYSHDDEHIMVCINGINTKIVPIDDFYPLELAYGLTIHKSEGETMPAVIVDATNSMFEAGQAYVGVSRVPNMSGLYTVGLTPDDFMLPRPPSVQAYINTHKLL